MTIDTDKYEGHTEGKREIQHNAFIHIEGRGLYATIAGGFTTADARLMADAPLLLAEVKRLQKQVRALLYENQRLEARYHMDVHGDDTLEKILERKK